MRGASHALFALFLATGLATAEDLTTTDGKTYKNVTVTKVEPDGLSIAHESGTAKVPFTKLPVELQRKHGFEEGKAQAYAKEQARKRAELEAILNASKEKEEALARAKLTQAYTISPEAAEGISLAVQSRAQFLGEEAARLREELYSEAEIAKMLPSYPLKSRLLVSWKRPDYDAAAAEHFRVVVSNAAGKVLSRVTPDYRAPKQTAEGECVNGATLNVEWDLGDEFRVRVVDRSLKVHADFSVQRVK